MVRHLKRSFEAISMAKLWAIVLVGVVAVAVFRAVTVAPYRAPLPYDSDLRDALALFTYNKSAFPDAVAGCWYDSGDYLVFLHRNALTLWYLSLAYRAEGNETARADIARVLADQLPCAETMLQAGLKQFRDQRNHGLNLSPLMNRWMYGTSEYGLRQGEGGDIAQLLALTEENIGNADRAKELRDSYGSAAVPTTTEACCEEGPIVFSTEWQTAIASLPDGARMTSGFWGAQPPVIAALAADDTESIRRLLQDVEVQFTSYGEPFDYLGGNYDIAGTVVAARLYAMETGDESFDALADRLWSYLHGENVYRTDFTMYPKPYHPCAFLRACSLRDTLVNGIDERHDAGVLSQPWRVAEVQTYGQAIYVLARVLQSEGAKNPLP